MVEFIDYKGKKHPVRIGYTTLKKLKQEKDIDVDSDPDSLKDILLFEPILLFGLQSGAKAMDQKCTFKEEDMEDVLDEIGINKMSEIMEKFFPKGKDVKKPGPAKKARDQFLKKVKSK